MTFLLRFAALLAILASLAAIRPFARAGVSAAPPIVTPVFVSGEGGYHTYRIPALITTTQGTLLAFCEGRKNGDSDRGDIDVLLRRSRDGGQTWEPVQVVWDDGPHTAGNPCAVVDRETGTIWLLLTWNSADLQREADVRPGFGSDSRRVFVTSSTDDGVTWAPPREITADVKRPGWSWYATGPGSGIQLTRGPHRGRLVIPCDHKEPLPDGMQYRSHVIYSDDHGATWHLGGSTGDGANECEVVELADGRLLLNSRNAHPRVRFRQVSESTDGGLTWHHQRIDRGLPEPVCQASIHRHSWPASDKPGVILFSNPASTAARWNLTVRASRDEGATWSQARLLNPGASAYSSLAVLPDGTAGCFFEGGPSYDRLLFARFSLDWLAEPSTAAPPVPSVVLVTSDEILTVGQGENAPLAGLAASGLTLTRFLNASPRADANEIALVHGVHAERLAQHPDFGPDLAALLRARGYATAQVAHSADAAGHLDRSGDAPFFVHLVHRRKVQGGESLREVVGNVNVALAQRGATENTLVLVVAPQGARHDVGQLREAVLHDTLIAIWPGHIPPGTSTDLAHATDLLPTVAALARADVARLRLDGIDLTPHLFDRAPLPRRIFVWESATTRVVRNGPWKAVSEGDAIRLFNVNADPEETRDLAPERDAHARGLLNHWRWWSESVAANPEGAPARQVPADARTVHLIVGPARHPPGTHEAAAGARLLAYALQQALPSGAPPPVVHEGWPARPGALQDAAALVFLGDQFPPARLPDTDRLLVELEALAARGCGFVAVHYAIGLNPPFARQEGLRAALDRLFGGFANFIPLKEGGTVPRILTATIEPEPHGHPVLRGVRPFTLHDEPYYRNRFAATRPGTTFTVLATAQVPPEEPRRETIAWSLERTDGARGAAVVMPHFFANWRDDALRTLILNGVLWAARLPVPADGAASALPPLETFGPAAVFPADAPSPAP